MLIYSMIVCPVGHSGSIQAINYIQGKVHELCYLFLNERLPNELAAELPEDDFSCLLVPFVLYVLLAGLRTGGLGDDGGRVGGDYFWDLTGVCGDGGFDDGGGGVAGGFGDGPGGESLVVCGGIGGCGDLVGELSTVGDILSASGAGVGGRGDVWWARISSDGGARAEALLWGCWEGGGKPGSGLGPGEGGG